MSVSRHTAWAIAASDPEGFEDLKRQALALREKLHDVLAHEHASSLLAAVALHLLQEKAFALLLASGVTLDVAVQSVEVLVVSIQDEAKRAGGDA